MLPSGCHLFEKPARARRVNYWLAEEADLANIRRVMVMPFLESAGVDADVEELHQVFVGELNKLQRFEVIPLPHGAHEDQPLLDSLRTGRLDSAAIVGLSRRYSLDAIVLGTITTWRPYKPPHLGLRTQMISIHTGSAVWAADGAYDTGDGRTVEDMRHYYRRRMADSDDLHEEDLLLISPSRFAGFVMHRLVSTWKP